MAFTVRHWGSHIGAADVASVLGCDGVLVRAVPEVLKRHSAFVFSLEQSKKTSCATKQTNQKTKSEEQHEAQVDILWSI
jgi:predicted TPR repeat methyltransferase